MEKPQTSAGYTLGQTVTCERALVTLLRGLGPWKDSIYLVGGLAARYLTPTGSSHVGTLDVDVVVDIQLLAGIEAYRSFEDNLRRSGLAPIGRNGHPVPSSWRWRYRNEAGDAIVVELLTDDPEKSGGQAQVLPGEGAIRVANIPHSSIVFDHYQVREVTAELLGGDGIASERVRHADLLGLTCLKALAIEERFERKDAYDLIQCIEHAEGGLDGLSESIRRARASKHGAAVEAAVDALRKHFASDEETEGYEKDGPVAVSKFEKGEEVEQHEARILRQRGVADLIEDLLSRID